jgi:predicted protein tyrosine phosphatase
MELWMEGGKPADGMNRFFQMYDKVWFISIVDQGHPRAMTPGDDTICFGFDDIDIDDLDEWRVNGVRMEFGDGVLFTPKEATRMVAFLEMAHADPRRGLLAVHCHAGVSRSAGVATFVQEAYGLSKDMFEMMNPYISPNQFVIRLLKEALVNSG